MIVRDRVKTELGLGFRDLVSEGLCEVETNEARPRLVGAGLGFPQLGARFAFLSHPRESRHV
jgi:hypothetical protein